MGFGLTHAAGQNRAWELGLPADQCRSLLQAPDRQRLKGRRDRAILAILLSVGLHQAEAAKLQSRDVQQRKARWALVDLMRKGRHIRTVPVPDWVNAAPYEGTTARVSRMAGCFAA